MKHTLLLALCAILTCACQSATPVAGTTRLVITLQNPTADTGSVLETIHRQTSVPLTFIGELSPGELVVMTSGRNNTEACKTLLNSPLLKSCLMDMKMRGLDNRKTY